MPTDYANAPLSKVMCLIQSSDLLDKYFARDTWTPRVQDEAVRIKPVR
jgi:hypothetical protein